MSLCALITTCGRPEGLLRTLDALGDTPAIVLQDGGVPYVPKDRVAAIRMMPYKGGKEQYWNRINSLWELAKNTSHDTFIHLPDDFHYHPGWLDTIMEEYRGNPMNIYNCGRSTCWGQPGFVDGAFITPRSAIQSLYWRVWSISPLRWEKNPTWGSGVWRQVTMRWIRRGIHIDRITANVIDHDWSAEKSQMNKNRQ